MSSSLAQIREETDQKSDGDWFFLSGWCYQDVIVVCVLMFLRKGVKAERAEEKKAAKEGNKNWKKYKTKQANKQKREENRRRGQDMEAIVEEELQLDGAQVRAMLRNTGVLQWHGATKQGSLVVQDDLIGIKGGGELCIILHTFCISSSSSSKRPICGGAAAAIPKRKRKDMRLSFANETSRQMWYETIQRFLDEAGRPKKLMVIVNPFGGEGAEKKLFLQIVEPLLLAAKISFTMKETMFNSHAKDLANSMDLSQFDGIVCVSGDEVLVEVLNGLLQ